MKVSCFIDRGGTFTDALVVCEGRQKAMKVLSENPTVYPDSCLECVRLGLEWALARPLPRGSKLPSSHIEEIRIGTTIATNALLERKGTAFGYVTTKGFGHLLRIGSQARPDLFDLAMRHAPQVLYDHVVEVDERVVLVREKEGEALRPMVRQKLPSEDELRAQLGTLRDAGMRSIAIAFMHAALYPDHELTVASVARRMGCFTTVVTSAEAMPMVRLVSRGNTVCVEAYLTPAITAFVHSLMEGFTERNVRVSFMKSDGGLEPASVFSAHRAILSGPAGGVNGYAKTLSDENRSPLIGVDMGGTSTDVSRYDPRKRGAFDLVFESQVAGLSLLAPTLDINTVAAGGGSRLFIRQHRLFAVGPDSAGSYPGPVCYGHPGGQLALTDANAVLGRLVPSAFPIPIDVHASRVALHALVSTSSHMMGHHMTPEEAAMGFVRVANEAMARPIREITLAKGLDPSEHVLCAFGGAAGQHACALARLLGIRRIRVARLAGILSAVGLGLAEEVEELVRPAGNVELSSMEVVRDVGRALEELKHASRLNPRSGSSFRPSGGGDLHEEKRIPTFDAYVQLRYTGSETTLSLPFVDNLAQLRGDFIAAHRRLYGFELQRGILVEEIRVRARLPSRYSPTPPTVRSVPAATTPQPETCLHYQPVFLESGQWANCAVMVVDDTCEEGRVFPGPCLLLLPGTTTVWIEPQCVATLVGQHIDIEVRSRGEEEAQRDAVVSAAALTSINPVRLALFSHRFMGIAEQMGRTLRHTAVSVNIKERLDFSCALFGPDGGLVAHAPYIPVHLGALSAAVRAQITHWGPTLLPGDVLLSNAPTMGGSHLPDLTVLTPAFAHGRIVFWIANRGHHSDIGGSTPGSMPADSTRLDQEGAIIHAFKLVSARHGLDEVGVSALLRDSRNLADNLSDLRAQVAANARGVVLVEELLAAHGLDMVHAYMHHIRDHAEACIRAHLRTQPSPRLHALDYMDDGSPIELQVSIDSQGGAVFDFTGTGAEVLGNWNCPKAVVNSAIVYCLRCMSDEADLPLNEGVLAPIQVVLPPGSLLDPSSTAAVVGGNVLTSQRLCDVIFKAFGTCAASQGCMNNLSLGNPTFGYYETICGGAGAGPSWHGRDAIHTHMTNTRIGDPEIIEHRFPLLLVRQFALRPHSGGQGQWRGGAGCIRELEFRGELTCSILSERRVLAPFGLQGGGPGARGLNLWYSKEEGLWRNVGGKHTWTVKCGDVVHIETPGGGGYGLATTQSKL